jgi:hypothetical protein
MVAESDNAIEYLKSLAPVEKIDGAIIGHPFFS